MVEQRCPSCGFPLAIGEADDYAGVCRICFQRQVADAGLNEDLERERRLMRIRAGDPNYDLDEEMGEAGWVGGQ